MRLSQPGLSAQLRRIEAMLGGSLFSRTRTGVVPTAFGEVILARARSVLPGLDELVASATRIAASGDIPSRIRLGSVNSPLLSGLIGALGRRHPEARITSRWQSSAIPLMEDVAAGRLEAAVVGDTPGYELPCPPGVLISPVVTEPVFVLLPDMHEQAAKQEVSLEELAGDDWVAPHPDNDRIQESWAAAFAAAGHHMRTTYEAEGRVFQEIIRAGHGVGLCQPTYEAVPGIAVRPIAGNPLWYRHLIVWHRDGPLARIGRSVIDDLTDAYQVAVRRNPVYVGWIDRNGGSPSAAFR